MNANVKTFAMTAVAVVAGLFLFDIVKKQLAKRA